MVPTSRRFYIGLSCLGLAVYVWGYWTQLHMATIPAEFPPADTAYPVQLESVFAGSRDELRALAWSGDVGSTFEIRTATGVTLRTVLVPFRPLRYLIVVLVSTFCFWAVSTFVFGPRVRMPTVRDFFWCSYLYGLALAIGGFFFPKPPAWPGVTLGLLHTACLALLPALFLRLSLNFPRRNPVLDRGWLVPALIVTAAALFAWQSVHFLRYYWDPSPSHHHDLSVARTSADVWLIGQVAVAFWMFFASSKRLPTTRERDQTKLLLWGFMLGLTPYVLLRSLPKLMGFRAPLGPEFDRVFELAIPLAFVMSVVRDRFLNIDIIIRRSLIYLILATALVGTYLGLALAIGRSIEGSPLDQRWISFLVVGIVAGLLFDPIRTSIGRWVDRTFFKIQYNHAQAVREFRTELEQVRAPAAVAAVTARFLGETLHPQRCAVVVPEDDELRVSGTMAPARARLCFQAFARGEKVFGNVLAAPESTSLPEIESSDAPEVLVEEGIPVAQAVHLDGQLVGLFLLSAKETERRYVKSEITVLRECADIVRRTLESIQLSRAVVEETMNALRLDELNRMKSDFLSRVAHDLRTPLASISWSTDNLLDGIAGGMTESQKSYLQSIRHSASHLNRLVANLLEISRLEQSTEKVRLEPVDLHQLLQRGIKVVEPIAQSHRVGLELLEHDPMAPANGNGDRLLEVVVNLLDNAVKYSPSGSTVQLSLENGREDRVGFRVRDHGPGIDPSLRDALFERFRQADSSPHSQRHGFGLGLYVVKSTVELMAGEVSAANHPEGGAVFSCFLPVYAPLPSRLGSSAGSSAGLSTGSSPPPSEDDS